MTASPGWSVPVPAQTEPGLRPVVERRCFICGRTGPDLGLTADEREMIRLGRSALVIPAAAVSAAMVRWHAPQQVPHAQAHIATCGCGRETVPLLTTREYRCEDHEACWRWCVDIGDMWPVDDRRPRYGAHRALPDDGPDVPVDAGDDAADVLDAAPPDAGAGARVREADPLGITDDPLSLVDDPLAVP